MSKDTNKNATGGGERPSVDQSEDEMIQEILGEHAPSDTTEETPEERETEEKPGTKDPEGGESSEQPETKDDGERSEEGSSDEKKPESSESKEKEEEKKPETNKETREEPRRPSRLDRRISRKYIELRTLQGNDTSNLNEEEIAAHVAQFPTEKRQAELHRLLAETKKLRGDKTPVELSGEDIDALADERAEEKIREKEADEREQVFRDDFIKTYEEHPELDESKKEYDPKFAEAVESLVQSGQYLLSEAVEKIQGLVSDAREKAGKEVESQKRKALSGALSGSGSKPSGESLTYEELARIQQEDPERYLQIVQEGNLPEE